MASRLEDALAARLRELARAKKIPLSHVADRAGIARSYLWSLLKKTSSATLAVIQRIADALGVEPLELLKPDEKPTSEGPLASARKQRRADATEEPPKPKKAGRSRSPTTRAKRR
ncbi:MAG: helix-turn-helix transcriptional regulator [Labilithrix sp.]|nr:helix-turn-helix transcriptional regulator [Labilithrix sp.]MCW5811625.1 helix-turn-helix transcriptional regulator [Labilithrix sp.]